MTPGSGDGPNSAAERAGLARQLGLWGLAATGICSMLGAGINVVPVMVQRNVPGIGENVLTAFAFGALPAVLAALAYAILASAMPRAGGSYVFASRALGPYWGFVASFSQWFGLSIVIGVVSYLVVPFLRDIAGALGMAGLADVLDTGSVRVALALAMLWVFAWVNLRGLRAYERTVVPLMLLMFALGAIVIVAGFAFDHADFAAALLAREGTGVPTATPPPLGPPGWLAASALLFASFVGFDAIAQAGGEARNPGRALPLAIGLAVFIVGTYYLLFTAAVYHAVPWEFVWARAQEQDLTAPGLLGYVLPAGWTVAIVAGAAIALINDLPAMILSVSRLVFAWAEDRIFPERLARVHPSRQTPQAAILLSTGPRLRRDPRLALCGRFLPWRRHHGHVDARQLHPDVRFRPRPAATEPVDRQRVPRYDRAGRPDVCLPRRDRPPRDVSRHPHMEGSDRRRGRVVLSVHSDLDRRDDAGLAHLRPEHETAARLRRRRGATVPGAAPRPRRSVTRPPVTKPTATPPPATPAPAPERRELAPGLEISRVLTGLWQIADLEREGPVDARAAAAAMNAYADARLTTFDMADHYGSAEEIAGACAARREGDLQLLTKWTPPPGPRAADGAREAVERSLDRLRADAIDLLQFHAWRYADPSWLDCLFALRELRDEGLIRHLGLTNFDAVHLDMVLRSGIEVVSNQGLRLAPRRARDRAADGGVSSARRPPSRLRDAGGAVSSPNAGWTLRTPARTA